jgi:hypothetical protein
VQRKNPAATTESRAKRRKRRNNRARRIAVVALRQRSKRPRAVRYGARIVATQRTRTMTPIRRATR